MAMGKIAVMRLNANPAAKFMTQSLVNLVQKAWKDLTPFSAVCFASEVFCGSCFGSVRVGDAWVAITDPPGFMLHFSHAFSLFIGMLE
jgi:hypothetical protein